jgi:predicted secreted protein
MSNAIFGKGTLLQVETSPGSGTYTTIAEVKSISGPTGESDEIDVTNHDSVGDYREFVRGLIDAGEITTSVNWQPDIAIHQQLHSDQAAGTKRNWRINWNQMTVPWGLSFEAFVKTLGFENPVDNVLAGNATLRVTGATTLAAI